MDGDTIRSDPNPDRDGQQLQSEVEWVELPFYAASFGPEAR